MEEKVLNKLIVLLLLSNKNKAFANGHTLIKALSKWFNIISFIELIKEMTEENLVDSEIINQVGNYELTLKGKHLFSSNKDLTEAELRKVYPQQQKTIDILFSSLE
jgi:hypothetical protein